MLSFFHEMNQWGEEVIDLSLSGDSTTAGEKSSPVAEILSCLIHGILSLMENSLEQEKPAGDSSTILLKETQSQGLGEAVRTVLLLVDAHRNCQKAVRAIETAKRLQADRKALKIRLSYWCSPEIN